MKKILPIADPPIKSYLHHAYGLSILATSDAYLPWFYSNYIQVFFDKHYRENPYVDYYNFFYYPYVEINIPHLERLKFDRAMLTEEQLNADFICRLIDLGYYICLYADEYYIPDRVAYKNFHFKHEVLIFGYDREERIFHILGFNRERVYGATTVPIDDLMEAFSHGYDGDGDLFWRKYIIAARLFRDTVYPFNLKLITDLLEDYLESRESNSRVAMYIQPPRDCVFGLASYAYIDEALELMERGEFFIDYRLPSVIWEHKQCMTKRLQYMHGLGLVDQDVCDQFAKVEDIALKARNTMLKAFVTNQRSIISRIREMVQSIHEQEKAILVPLLQHLKSQL